EFPAVLLNTSTGEIESEFHTYVQPQEHPILSEFCTELTGITQNQVDDGVPLNICLSQFLKWIQKIQKEKKIIFSTDILGNSTSEAKACTFVTWTDWDLGVCLQYECKRKQLRKPDILNSWIDLKATYRAFYNRKSKGLNGALQDLGMAFAGREHSGLDDSRNTARLAWRLICDGCVLRVTKSLDKVSVHVVPSSSSRTQLHAQSQSSSTASTDRVPVPLGQAQQCPSTVPTGIWPGLSNGQPLSAAQHSPPVHRSGLVLVSTTIPSVSVSSEEISTSSDCLSLLTDWEDVALIPESQFEQNSERVQFKDDSNTDILTVCEEKTMLKQLSVVSSDHQSLEKTLIPMAPLKSIICRSPDPTVYSAGRGQRQTLNLSAFKLPSLNVNAVSAQSALTGNYSTPLEVPKRKPTSPKTFPPAKKQSFAVYQEKTVSFDHSLPLGNLNLPKASPAILNSMVNLNQSARAVKNGKPTPPLCKCGRRAKKLNVSNAGPNHGRAFFCCPVGKHEGNEKGCGYFKWEHALLKEKSNGLALNADALTSLGTYASNSSP
ncbi:PREDICTED: ERI1 exoribonuclease 2, partial [Leptosomus discolor]|uniref:ERI1 exoribonuclease 2 n=1 Tax=Leptosomus discolor TaxID=188344 RepID=UPI000522B57A